MGLLQRFARPEYRKQRESDAAEQAAPDTGLAIDQGGERLFGSEASVPHIKVGQEANAGQEVHINEAASEAVTAPASNGAPPATVSPGVPGPPPQASVQVAQPGNGAAPVAPPDNGAAQVAQSGNAPAPQPAEPVVKKAKVIAFANQKGGVAKTTTTLNLAVAFAETGHRVLAVDMDPQGNLTMSQGIDPDTVEKSMYHVLVDNMPIREAIRKREVDVACSSIDLAGAEIAMSMKIGRERSLEKALKPILEDYDFICIDTPPSLGLLTINALTAADKVIVPVQCEYLSMRGLIQLQNTLSMIREELNPDVQIEGILPTLVDTRTVHAKEAIEILEENFGDQVFATRIRKTIRFAEAPVKGTSVLKYDPHGVAAESYRDLAKEVLADGRR
jgi:chromosome partitioning protein